MTVADKQIPLDELDGEPFKVVTWRREQMKAAGIPGDDIFALADDPNVDVETVRQLLQQGCPPELVRLILT